VVCSLSREIILHAITHGNVDTRVYRLDLDANICPAAGSGCGCAVVEITKKLIGRDRTGGLDDTRRQAKLWAGRSCLEPYRSRRGARPLGARRLMETHSCFY